MLHRSYKTVDSKAFLPPPVAASWSVERVDPRATPSGSHFLSSVDGGSKLDHTYIGTYWNSTCQSKYFIVSCPQRLWRYSSISGYIVPYKIVKRRCVRGVHRSIIRVSFSSHGGCIFIEKRWATYTFKSHQHMERSLLFVRYSFPRYSNSYPFFRTIFHVVVVVYSFYWGFRWEISFCRIQEHLSTLDTQNTIRFYTCVAFMHDEECCYRCCWRLH